MSNLDKVHQIAIDYFGEDLVDTKNEGKVIIIKFPELTVTNEYGRSTIIYDLFSRIDLDSTGKLDDPYIKSLRSTYTEKQFKCRYIHSHAPTLSYSYLDEWSSMCTGTGPIKDTMRTLESRFDELSWELFFVELAKYYTVESLSGGPYIRLDKINVGTSDSYDRITNLKYSSSYLATVNLLKTTAGKIMLKTAKKLLDMNVLPYVKKDTYIDLALTTSEFTKLATKVFIENNEENLFSTFLMPCIITAAEVAYIHNSNAELDIDRYEGREILTFKGEIQRLHIIKDVKNENISIIKMLKKEYVATLYTYIINLVNIEYGKVTNANIGKAVIVF